MGNILFDELNRTNAAYCKALGLDASPYESKLSPEEAEIMVYMQRHNVSHRAASMLIAVNTMPARPLVMGPRHRTFCAVVEYARTPEQIAESNQLAYESMDKFYAACRRRTIAPVFCGD